MTNTDHGPTPTEEWKGPDPAAERSTIRLRAGAEQGGASPPGMPAPEIPGYEILGLLGHGGMGIVYRACQQSLKRIVALKMILGGRATSDQLARFRMEAEAVAAFQHPNIVQIYEVGEHQGLPYCSLEYVDGPSLARQWGHKPMPPERAAELVETLARAMHYAHQKKIVHRDLKPSNILLTADGVPKISDFGLVKRIEDDSHQTTTGEVLGTPNYMAPEQARGEREIGAAADIYDMAWERSSTPC